METPIKVLLFSQKKTFLIFQETKNPKKLLIFQEVTFYVQKMLYFEIWDFLIFPEVACKA